MKNYLNLRFAYLLCFSVLLFGCSASEETIIVDEMQQKEIESVLSEMKKVGDAEGKIVVLEIKDFNKKGYEKNFELLENSKKVLAFSAGSNDLSAATGNAFKVTYTLGNGEAKVAKCKGEAILDCLESYASSNFNIIKMVYTPLF